MKYRVGRKQKRVILDENGHEVAICHDGKEDVAQMICDLLNGVKNNDLSPVVSQQRELLINFLNWHDSENLGCFPDGLDDRVNEYLKLINCG